MNHLQDRIQYILDHHPELDQVKLGNAAGAAKSVVNQWLSGGIKSLHIDYALGIEQALGYDHIWLMTGRGEPVKAPHGYEAKDQRILHAIEVMQQMEDYQIDQAVTIIDTIAQPTTHKAAGGKPK